MIVITGGPEREDNPTYRAELFLIYLLAEDRCQGLGRRLVSAVAGELRAEGFYSMLVWVLKDNNAACRFYESLGGELVGSKTITIGARCLVEVSYGWKEHRKHCRPELTLIVRRPTELRRFR